MALVGIDLGTCNSVISTMENGRVQVIENFEGQHTTPSVVFFNSSSLDEADVGKSAVFASNNNPERAVRFIKKQMGTDFEFKIDDAKYTPEEISAAVLKKLKRDAERNYFGGEEITDAVITVPAWFEQRQIDATKRAGEMAGLKVRLCLTEPIAAAIDYVQNNFDKLMDKVVLVYDLGGGTFDATLIRVTASVTGQGLAYEVLNKAGSTELGGYNWDKSLHDHVAAEFQAAKGSDPRENLVSSDLLREKCREAKEVLSSRDRDYVVPILCTHDGMDHTVEITRGAFEKMTQSLLDESISKVNELMLDTFGDPTNPGTPAVELWKNVPVILLVGGSTKMPIVGETLERISGVKPTMGKGVDLNVGRGAALAAFCPEIWVDKSGLNEVDANAPVDDDGGRPTLGEVLKRQAPTGDARIAKFTEMTRQSIGVLTVDEEDEGRDINSVIIPAGTKSGTVVTQTYGVFQDGQTGVDIVINAGDSKDLALVECLGSAQITGLPSTTRRGEEIRVSLSLDGNGLITGEAMHVPTGKKTAISVKYEPKKQPGASDACDAPLLR